MGAGTEYRRRAQECLESADKAKPHQRKTLMEIAATWLNLADSAEIEDAVTKEAATRFAPTPETKQ